MSKQRPAFNPASFSNALTEKYYTKKSNKRKNRQKLVNWLRQKAKDNERAQEPADKVDACRRKIGANPRLVRYAPMPLNGCSPGPPAGISSEDWCRLRHDRAR